MYRVKNGKAELMEDELNKEGKKVGKIYKIDGLAVLYRSNSNGESFYPVKNQDDYVKGVRIK